jgi:hypothetical protein
MQQKRAQLQFHSFQPPLAVVASSAANPKFA